MDSQRREQLASGLERLGYHRDSDGTFRICPPFRELEQPELKQIFFDGTGWSQQPRQNFDALMEQLARRELEALAGQLEAPELSPEELAGLARVCLPVREYLDRRCRCDILVDTGDAGSDYSLNTLSPGYDGSVYGVGYRLYDRAGIVWLTKQQGHTKAELADALHRITNPKNGLQGYLRSAAYEAWHETTCENQLCFLAEMTLEQAMLIQAAVQWGRRTRRWNGYVVLDRRGRAGFFDSWRGGGSLMGLALERDVKLPMKYIAAALPDAVLDSYNVYSVYMDDSMWEKGRVKQITLPKKFRLEMEDMGFAPRIKNKPEEG